MKSTICPESGILKMLAGSVPFCTIIGTGKRTSKHFPSFSDKMFLRNNSIQTWFWYIYICWIPREVFQHLPRGPEDVNA